MLSFDFVLGLLLGTFLGALLMILSFTSWNKIIKEGIKEYIREEKKNE